MTESEQLKLALEALCVWYWNGHRDLPWRRTKEPYPVWVSEIMLQQTRVQAVIPYYERFMRALPTVQALAEVPEEQLLKLWEGLGYYTRARSLQKAARMVCEQYKGEMPCTYDVLLTLPGIGPYTAGAVASIAGGQKCPAVDGNVLRVLSRLFAREWDIKAQAVKRQAERELLEAMPEAYPGDCNQALMELGAMVCLPNGEPLCGSCPVAVYCTARERGIQKLLPVKASKKIRSVERRVVCLLWKDGRLALRKRPEKGLLANLWEFPNFLEGEDIQDQLGVAVRDVTPLRAAKHIFTHLEWHMTGVEAQTNDSGYFTWVSPEQLEHEIALPSAFRAYRSIALRK
ncbi:MAG: A/G-specific adenine glycosylase [Eubacteriales bacterium]|nr:A/G-specific adenine glycosylase [Eubacteriales bacterium]